MMFSGTSVPVADVYFRFKRHASVEGQVTDPSAASSALDDAPPVAVKVVKIGSDAVVQPLNAAPLAVKYNDVRAAFAASDAGWVNVAPIRHLGIFAFLQRSDIINVAVLTGVDVTSEIRALVISNYERSGGFSLVGSASDTPQQQPSGGSVVSAADEAPEASSTVLTCSTPSPPPGQPAALSLNGCQLRVASEHSVGSPQSSVAVRYGDLSDIVDVSIWVPTNMRLQVRSSCFLMHVRRT